MFQTLLLVLVIAVQAPAGDVPKLGIVAGNIAGSADERPSDPVRVVLLPPQYANLWVSDVQKRLDMYWERYKPAFAQRKEFFFEVSRMAHRDSLEFIVSRMQRDQRIKIADYVLMTSADGKFEFKDLPIGEYRIVAFSKVGGVDSLWQETVEIRDAVPQFVRLKKIAP